MSYTQLFDDTDNLFDPDKFDTIKHYSVSITEQQTIFDSAIFGDEDQFDTVGGGIIIVADTVERLMAAYRTLSESESISDSISRKLDSFRTISESISVGVGVISTIHGFVRSIIESTISISDTIGRLFTSLIRIHIRFHIEKTRFI